MQICLPVANKKKTWNITSAKEKMFSETVFWSKKDIIPQPKIMFSEKAFGRKRYITSPKKNIVFWSKKDIILREKKMFSETLFGRKDIILSRKKMFSETVKKRYDTSPEKKFFDVLLLPFAKQIVCFHLNVFSVVYCVYCCIVS